jgi:hypothetical protein
LESQALAAKGGLLASSRTHAIGQLRTVELPLQSRHSENLEQRAIRRFCVEAAT